jgi:hypothetical protein
MQGSGGGGEVGPGADVAPDTGCGPADRALAVALASEFPAAGASALTRSSVSCPAGARWAGYQIRQANFTGELIALVEPAGAGSPHGAGIQATASASASGGRTVIVLTVAGSGSSTAPYADRVSAIAADLAGAV